MTDILAVVSDLHANSTSGLFPADGMTTNNGNRIEPNLAQRWTWDRWLAYWDLVAEARKMANGKLVVAVIGEFVDGFHHDSREHLLTTKQGMRTLGVAIMAPAMELRPDALVAVRGTAAHSGEQGEDDEEVAAALGAVKDTATGASSFYHLRISVGGTRFDLRHHVSSAGLPWTVGGNANRLAARLVSDYYEDPPDQRPHLAFRAHVHRYADSHDLHPIRAIVCDPWQLSTSFGHKVDHGARMHPVGGQIVYCDGNDYEVRRHHWAPTRAPMVVV